MDSGQFAWAIAATALVVFMTPGIALFYGGLVRAKSVVGMMMLSFGAMGVVAMLWVLIGFNMSGIADADDGSFPGFQFAGNPFTENFGLAGYDSFTLISAAFGCTFAMATTALISGAIADRAKFTSWLVFAAVWSTVVYFPVAAWVWGAGGWIFDLGEIMGFDVSTIDYAGGTAVHINSAAAALALALVLGRRSKFAKDAVRPHNVPLMLLGVGILFFGWFGFNGGAEGTFGLLGPENSDAGKIIINTLVAGCAGIFGWVILEQIRRRKSTAVGAGSGAIAGLVAITPACASVDPVWALVLGLLAGVICGLAVELKWRLGFDDSLDVVGIHGVGGLLGCWFLGFFAQGTGLFMGGDLSQLVVQVVASLAVALYSFVVSYAIGWAIEKTMGFRVKSEDEELGIDAVHHEEAYALT